VQENIIVKVTADISDFSRKIKKVSDVGTVFKDLDGRWRNAQGQFVKMSDQSKKLGGALTSAASKAKSFASSVTSIASGIGVYAAVSKGIGMISSSLDTAISRYDTLNNFPKVLQRMGFEAEDAQGAINKLSDGIQGLPTTLDSVASTTQRLALMTGDLDGAVDTTLALNNAFLASGSSSADAARGLEQYIQMMAVGKVDMAAWTTLQETMPYALNKTAEAFGYTGESGKAATQELYDALKSGKITFDDFNKQIIKLNEGVGGFAELAKDATDGIRTAWTNMRTDVAKGVTSIIGSIDSVLANTPLKSIANIIDQIGDSLYAFLEGIAKGIPIAVGFIGQIKDAIEPWVPTIQNVVSTVRTFIVEGLSQGFEIAKQIFASFSKFWQENGQTILTNAITIFTGIWETVQTAFSAISTVVSDVLGTQIVPFIQVTLANIQQFWRENGEQIMTAVQNAFTFIQTVIQTVMPVIQFIIEVVWSAIKDIIQGALSVIQGLIQIFSGIFTGDFSQMWEGVKSIFKGAIDLIVGWMSLSFLGGLRNILTNLFKTGVNIIKNMWTNIVNFFRNFGANVTNIATNLVSSVIGFFRNLLSQATSIFNTLRTFGASIWNSLSQAISGVVRGIVNTVRSGFSNMLSAVRNSTQNIRSTIVNIWNNIKSFLSNINLFNIGKNIIQGLVNGIGSMASAVVDKVKSIASSITNGIKSFLGIKSPSRVLRDEVGRWIPEGLIEGISNMERDVVKTANLLAEWATPDVPDVAIAYSTPSGLRSSLSSAVSGTVDVNTRDDMLAAAINRLEQSLDGMTIVMDGERVGQLVRPHVNEGNAVDALVRRYFD
jgi:tape measure domain-containing protein